MELDMKHMAIRPSIGSLIARISRATMACLLLAVTAFHLPAEAAEGKSVPEPRFGKYTESVADMKVKVLGGDIRVSRTWENKKWTINRRWSRITIIQSVTLDSGSTDSELSSTTLNRNGTEFTYTGNGIFADEEDPNYTITKTETGYRWKDRKGNWIDYDEEGYVTSYGDANNVTVRLAYDAEHLLTGVFDHNDKQILWYIYGDNSLTIRDYTERQVKYIYDGGKLVQFIDLRGNAWIYTYTNGEIKTKTDPLGRVTTFDYNSNRTIKSITRPDGHSSQYKHEYDKTKKEYYKQVKSAAGKLTETWHDEVGDLVRRAINGNIVYRVRKESERKWIETDASGNETIVEYDEHHNPLKKTYADGGSESWTYDATLNKVLQHVDENGVVTKNEYNDFGKLIKKTEALGKPVQRITTYRYDEYGNQLSKTIVADAVSEEVTVSATYDAYGNKSSSTDGEGNVTAFTHDVMGNVLTRTTPGNHTWTYTYDSAGNLLTTTTPLDVTTTLEYDQVGNKVTKTDPLGNVTEYDYDTNNRLVSVTDPLNQMTTIDYDADGHKTKIVDPSGAVSKLQYDDDGRQVAQTGPAGNTINREYVINGNNGAGEVAVIHYPTYSVRYSYDKRGNKVRAITELSASNSLTETYTYDAVGNRTSTTDAKGRNTLQHYDVLGRLVKTTDAAGGINTYVYDNRDNLLSVNSAKGVVIRRFAYDKLNRVVSEAWPDERSKTYSYEDATGIVTRIDAKGQVTRSKLNAEGRLVGVDLFSHDGDTEPVKHIDFTHDAKGQVKQVTDGDLTIRRSYNALGQQISEEVDYGSFTMGFQYEYDAAGRKKSFTQPDGVKVTYDYDNAGRLTGVALPQVGTLTWNGYEWNAPTEMTLPGGSSIQWGYDALLRPTHIEGKDSGGNSLLRYAYSYDAVGNITTRQTEHGDYVYGYDTLDRLISVDNPALTDEAYSYDAVGNRLTDAKQEGQWLYEEDDRLISRPGVTYQYDANGSLIEQNDNGIITKYKYDITGRLSEVRDGNDNLIAHYSYDPFGRRYKKTSSRGTTYFFYSDEGLIAEVDGTGTITRQYGWQPSGIWGTDPLYLFEGDKAYFYQNDHLGTPQKLVTQSGAVVWNAQYKSFGQAHVKTEAIENPLRFPGQYYDEATGKHYNYFRDYDPVTGRYLESDPVGLRGGINHYLYAKADPTNFYDPKGLMPAPWCDWIDIISQNCPDVGDDIDPEDVPEEWIDEQLKDICNKPCEMILNSCKRLFGPGCYYGTSSCLMPCYLVKDKCEKKQKEVCNISCNYSSDGEGNV